MMWFGMHTFDMTLHHIMTTTSMLQSLVTNNGTYFNCLALLCAEVSHPAMNTRAILRDLNLRYTKLYDFLQLIFFITFFFGRVILGHPGLVLTCMCESSSLLMKICAVGIVLQSYLYLYRMYFVFIGGRK